MMLMQNDYEFIMSGQPKKSGGLMQGPKQKMLLMIAAASIVIILVIVGASTLLNSGKPSASTYIPIVVYQEELIRMLEERDGLADQALKAKYTTLYLALQSDYRASTEYMQKNGLVIQPEQRTPYYFFDFETDLETAATANRFDSELESYVDKAVEEYSSVLVNLEPTKGQTPLVEQAKQNIIYYNGPVTSAEE